MPPLTAHQSGKTTKLLFIGDSGAGKSGALASLASEGYNLRILDLDNGLDVLKNLLTDPRSQYKTGAADRVEFVTVTDQMKNVNGKLVPSRATAWTRAINLLAKWEYDYCLDDAGNVQVLWDAKAKTDAQAAGRKIEHVNLGPITTWTSQDVLVIDSLTMLSNAALAFICSLNGRLGQRPHQSDWGDGQNMVEGLLQMLYDDGVQCNVVVNCHITFIGEDNGPQRGYPNCLGKALPPKVGRYFNSALMARSTGQGTNIKRKILTNTSGVVELKNTAPHKVLAEYPLETGLADYFRAVRG